MTRVFVLNHYPVLPLSNGGQQGVYGMVLQLARQWPTELVWIQRKTRSSAVHTDGDTSLRIRIVPNLWRQRHLARLLRHWLGTIEGDIGTLLCSGANRALVEHLVRASEDGDIFVLEHPWLWPALRAVLRRRRGVVVYDAHNVESVLKREAFPPGRISGWVLRAVERLEAELVRRADLVLACTALDMRALRALSGRGPEAFLVAGRGVSASEASRRSAAARALRPAGRVAVFVGARHAPNNAAARWIVESLAPQCPDWRFDIAGTCGPACGARHTTPNVRILGHVPDLAAVLDAATVGLNPVTLGSGINMKAVEYLHFGLPVVSTPFGARGFESEAPNGVQVAALEGFAAALQAAVADEAHYRRLSAQAAAFAAERLEWSAIGRRVRERVQAVAAAFSAPPDRPPPGIPASPAPPAPR